MATQKQRSEITRALLLSAFRTSFLNIGFEATTTQMVLDETGLSKGAMYHHFRSKTEIAEAIYEEESRLAIERAFQSVEQAPSTLDTLKGACLAWMAEVRDPDVSKILFEMGPTALGPEKAKEIEDSFSLKRIEALLDEAMAKGQMRSVDPKLIAAFLNSLVADAALYTLRTGKDSMNVLGASIDALFDAFRG